ncbi:MAG: DinB family protein [Anaerolineae bacterium]|nr:DinB family protein [Anaerolineae bacterium]
MAEQDGSLLPYYRGWETYQELLIKSVESLTPEQLAVRPAPHLRSIGENAAHIVGTRAGWFYFTLETGGEGLVKYAKWNMPDHPVPSAAELVEGLKFTWQVIHSSLSTWTPANLSDIFHDSDENGKIWDLTRQWVIWHLIEHDLHHGGELSFTLGMSGLPGISL